MIRLRGRLRAVAAGLERLQSEAGFPLRRDIAAAESSLNGGRRAQASQFLEEAEKEIDRLEVILGRRAK